jgi:hypothetical protein
MEMLAVINGGKVVSGKQIPVCRAAAVGSTLVETVFTQHDW